ncbi:MAG: 4Fe-4S dicluster domain-containing protein [Holophagales bacterium]|nr:MAG: 4Fe-4S dicluster domain-containing protein [Holophagales bacterium]
MNELQELAGRLLAEGTVQVVIGWGEGPRGVRPAFVREPGEASRLIFDERCTQNLVAYLSPRRSHVARLGRPAVVVKGCDARAVAGLLREGQLRREEVVVIGVRCGGVLDDPAGEAPTTADRCLDCASREPKLADHLVGELPPPPAGTARREARLDELAARSDADRWAFWQEELGRCVRCQACRQACPLCFCERCVADKTEPQWIESSPHGRGNFAWHVTRALHLAGRCTDCGECQRACPLDIPLGLINLRLARVVAERFGYQAGDDPTVPAPIGAYRLDDPQEFIL